MHDDFSGGPCAPSFPVEMPEAGASLDAALHRIETTMANIRRRIARRDYVQAVLRALPHGVDLNQIEVLGVIGRSHYLEAVGQAEEVTVGMIAERLAIDPSRASRLVAEVVEAGLARRVASQADARRICLELTDAGRDFADRFAATKRQVLRDTLAPWSEAEVIAFATLFERFDSRTRDVLAALNGQGEGP